MKISKIDVDISDLKLKATILSLIDRKEFLTDVANIRDEINMQKIYTREEWENVSVRRLTIYKRLAKNWPENTDSNFLINYANKKHDIYAHMLVIESVFTFRLTDKYKMDYSNFFTVIFCSILFNNINDGDLLYPKSHLFLNENLSAEIPPHKGTFNSYISINSQTKLEDVKKQFIKYQKHIKSKDTISNIDRNRKWYWFNVSKKFGGSGLSYSKIYEKIINEGERISYSGMEKAIQSYKAIITEV